MKQLHTKSIHPSLWWERKGVLGWWLNLTSPPRPANMSDLSTREYVRKSELVSMVIIALLIYILGLVSNSLSDPSTGLAAGILTVVSGVSLFLNRFGHTTIAAYLVTLFTILVIALSIILAKGGL